MAVSVGDREADLFELYQKAAQKAGLHTSRRSPRMLLTNFRKKTRNQKAVVQ
jgi:hypothetical protein